MKKYHSLSTHLVLVILLPLSVLLFVSAWFETRVERRFLLETAETAATNLSDSVAEELQGILRSTTAATNGLAISLEHQAAQDPAVIDSMLRDMLDTFPLIFGSTLAFDPLVGGEHQPLAPYAFRQEDDIAISSLSGDDYRYWEWPWFTGPMESGKSSWTDPYLDEGGGNVRMVTFSRPLEIDGRAAILTADIRLSFLSTIVKSNILGRAGAVMVFDRHGRLVAHPVVEFISSLTLDQMAELQSVPGLAEIADHIAEGERVWLRPEDGMHAGVVDGDPDLPGRLIARPLNEAGWGIAVYFSDQDFLQTAHAATRAKILFTAMLLVLIASLIVFASRRSLRPLGDLAQRTRSIANGEFSADTPGLDRRDEIGRLSRSFHAMQDHLQHYIRDLTQATAERERMEAELETAHQIQQMQLPAEHPADSALDMRLVARLRPARAVGGDLYYYRLMSEQRLVFAIGDVSDKGIPAALYMARAMALIKSSVAQDLSPGEVLAAVNQALTEDNDLCMFVTLLVGEVSLEDGSCRIASAGHEHPFHVARDGVEQLEIDTGPPVGLEEDIEYSASQFQLHPEECLFIYTDGITDARNHDGTMFGDDRLLSCLRQYDGHTPHVFLHEVVQEVDLFVGEAEQADDMTLMILQWHPPEEGDVSDMESGYLDYAIQPGAHREVLKVLKHAAMHAGMSGLEPPDLELMVEEVVVNVVSYSGLGPEDFGRVSWRMNSEFMEIRFEDAGVAFNPLERDEPDEEDHHFEEGGMGIMLIKALVDEALYERSEGRNILTLIRGTDPSGGGQEKPENA